MARSMSRLIRRSALPLLLWPWIAVLPQVSLAAPPAEVSPEHAKRAAAGLELFRKHVRRILNDRCVACHGRDSIEGGFDLASREGLLRGGDSGKAVVLGQSKKSLLYKLVTHAQQPRMPYEEEKLPEAEINHLAAWIDNEAPYDEPLVAGKEKPEAKPWTEKVVPVRAREHWAFQPLKRAAVPAVQNAEWPRTPVDRFLLARMEAEGLAPNPPADRRTLIRRASFTLLGLPPTPEEVEAFVADASPDAFERLVDRMLASPHYGERWARHWLDLARFAESHGFEHDYDRPSAFHYRDFVIRALNDDLPYDKFLQWQLAGDEIEPKDNLALMATGFLAAGVHSTQITANEVEKHRYDEMDDMLATTGTAMLGLTVGCARCHDHKFDPIPQADYYRLLSTFTTTVRTEVELDFDPETYRKAKSAFDVEHSPLVATRDRFEKEQLPARLKTWEATRPVEEQPKWILLDLVEFKSAGGATLTKQDDGSLLATGANPQFDTYTLVAQTDRLNISGFRLEALSHPSFVKGGPGRAPNGNFDLTDVRMTAAPKNGQGTPIDVRLQNPLATFEQATLPIKAAIDDNKSSGWAVDPQFGKDHAASFESAETFGFEGGTILTFTLKFEGNGGHNIGRPRLSLTTGSKPVTLEGSTTPANIVTALSTPADKRNATQTAELLAWYRHNDAEWQKLDRVVQDHLAKAPKPNLQKVLISSEGLPAVRLHTQGGDFFPETFFLRRGDTNQKQGAAPAGFLQVMMATPQSSAQWKAAPPEGAKQSFRRTSMARWLTDTERGAGALVARVAVNRLWQHHFGRGIVSTPSDFGTRGELPSHPELLDWLASELTRGDATLTSETSPSTIDHQPSTPSSTAWSLKRLHKLLLMSAAWQQSSHQDDVRASIDPDNRLFWRQEFRRLEGEVIRDALLAVSGRLDTRMLGQGTLDEGMLRRSVYFTMKRSQMISMMQVFDQPEPLSGVGERPSTTIAPQALMLLNNPQVREHARRFASQLSARGATTPAESVRLAYLSALARTPNEKEQADAIAFIEKQRGTNAEAGKGNAADLALVDFCQVLLCLNEFVFVE
jgi:mono/diheme cytochrome c family protein